jgi:uncharacterized membrane protein YozB (DUF420 family)
MNGLVNLLTQLFVVGLLLVGVYKVKKKQIERHYRLMVIVVSVNLLSILLIMIPSSLRILIGAGLSLFSFIVWLHLVAGIIIESSGIYLIVLKARGGNCYLNKRYMKILASSWVLEFLSGVIIYTQLYG